MYHTEHFSIDYYVVRGIEDLGEVHQKLVHKAREASALAYAPYSKFRVGAAVLLDGGTIVTASNKENASTPAGTCAERNALNYVSDHYPKQRILAIAIEADPLEFRLTIPVFPCGICRQVMAEVEKNQDVPFEVLLSARDGMVYIFKSSRDLLPFQFYVPELRN